MESVGAVDCQAAVFVYKDDASQAEAWDAVTKINTDHGGVRGELHSSKAMLLKGLSEWSTRVDASNAFLCIYAHMGSDGMNCTSSLDDRLVSWQELAEAISDGVEYLWLLGCKSEECLAAWSDLSNPVRHLLLATSESKYWQPLLRCFAAEISISNIVLDGDMPEKLKKMEPGLADHTVYYKPGPNGFEEV